MGNTALPLTLIGIGKAESDTGRALVSNIVGTEGRATKARLDKLPGQCLIIHAGDPQNHVHTCALGDGFGELGQLGLDQSGQMLPLVAIQHPHAPQLFLPIGVSRYLVTVMPSDDSGAPDPSGAIAFVVPGTTGIVYRPGAWHTGISSLDGEGSFAVMMWRGGEDDDVFADVEPLEVGEAASTAGVEGRAPGANRG